MISQRTQILHDDILSNTFGLPRWLEHNFDGFKIMQVNENSHFLNTQFFFLHFLNYYLLTCSLKNNLQKFRSTTIFRTLNF